MANGIVSSTEASGGVASTEVHHGDDHASRAAKMKAMTSLYAAAS